MSTFKVGDEVRAKSNKDLEALRDEGIVTIGDIDYLSSRVGTYIVIGLVQEGTQLWIEAKSETQGIWSFKDHEVELVEPIIDISLV